VGEDAAKDPAVGGDMWQVLRGDCHLRVLQQVSAVPVVWIAAVSILHAEQLLAHERDFAGSASTRQQL
jgi:hypothetical protein